MGRGSIPGSVRFRTLFPFVFSIPGLALAQAEPGATAYKEVCAVCHGQKGEGVPNQGPALKGSAFAKSASPDELKTLIKFGRTGKDKKYPQITQGMAAQALSAAELDAVVPYVQAELQK